MGELILIIMIVMFIGEIINEIINRIDNKKLCQSMCRRREYESDVYKGYMEGELTTKKGIFKVSGGGKVTTTTKEVTMGRIVMTPGGPEPQPLSFNDTTLKIVFDDEETTNLPIHTEASYAKLDLPNNILIVSSSEYNIDVVNDNKTTISYTPYYSGQMPFTLISKEKIK